MGTQHTAEHLVIDPSNIDDALVERAGAALREGQLVAIPTETVYGLGCNALDPEAVRAVFAAKERPFSDPLIVHVDGPDMVGLVIDGPVSPLARELMDRFWPGPLTIVLAKGDRVPDEITGGLETVAVRLPSHSVAAAIISAAGVPIAAPSANKFSRVSPTSADHVLTDLGDDCDIVVDAGRTERGLESTVVALDGDDVVILRHGAITMETLSKALAESGNGRVVDSGSDSAQSPGHAKRHYSPVTPTLAVSPGLVASLDAETRRALSRDRVLFAGYEDARPDLPAGWSFESFGLRAELVTVGHDLYESLRTIDSDEVDMIVLELTGGLGLGRAIDDRLTRAASSIVIDSSEGLLSTIMGQ